MHDFTGVKCSQATHNLDEYVPDLLLLDVGFSLLVGTDLLKHVSVIRVLHHEAQTARRLINKSFFVADHVWMFN